MARLVTKIKYPKPEESEYAESDKAVSGTGQNQRQSENNEPSKTPPHNESKERGKSGTGLTPRRKHTFKEAMAEVETDGQT